MTVLVGAQGPTWSRAAIQEAAQEARFRGTKLVAVSWLLGSQYVLRNAPCPALLVPDPAPAK